jgi:hypothetical protein
MSNEQQGTGLGVVIFEGDTAFRTFREVPGAGTPPQTGEIFNAGIMDSSFITVTDTPTLFGEFDRETSTGIAILRHTDRYQSKNTSHVENGRMVADKFSVEYTIVVVGLPPQQLRVSFNGPLSEGTGIFAEATGVINGHARRVNSPDPAVRSAFEGTISGEVRMPRHHYSD